MGATTVLAVLLSPIDPESVNTFTSLDEMKGGVGTAILHYYMDVMERQLFLSKELT